MHTDTNSCTIYFINKNVNDKRDYIVIFVFWRLIIIQLHVTPTGNIILLVVNCQIKYNTSQCFLRVKKRDLRHIRYTVQ